LVKIPRTVVEIHDDLHGRLKRLALLNDLRIHEVTNAAITDFLQDPVRIKATVQRLRVGAAPAKPILRERNEHLTANPAHSFTQFLHQYQ